MNKTEKQQTKSIYKSLAAFQQECPVIHKATKGYGYSYADLPTIFSVINPLLKKHKLGFTQLMNDNCIETTLFHIETGQTITSKTEIPTEVSLKGMNDFQVLGSACTYIRRYSLSSMLGIVTDKDTDAAGEQIAKKKKLSNDRFQKGIDKVSNDELSKDEFLNMILQYDLTSTQKAAIKLL
tara:strand:- start:52 stop:594 length:543 start_codon:yes stop_codon:yes gene_type:complete